MISSSLSFNYRLFIYDFQIYMSSPDFYSKIDSNFLTFSCPLSCQHFQLNTQRQIYYWPQTSGPPVSLNSFGYYSFSVIMLSSTSWPFVRLDIHSLIYAFAIFSLLMTFLPSLFSLIFLSAIRYFQTICQRK